MIKVHHIVRVSLAAIRARHVLELLDYLDHPVMELLPGEPLGLS